MMRTYYFEMVKFGDYLMNLVTNNTWSGEWSFDSGSVEYSASVEYNERTFSVVFSQGTSLDFYVELKKNGSAWDAQHLSDAIDEWETDFTSMELSSGCKYELTV